MVVVIFFNEISPVIYTPKYDPMFVFSILQDYVLRGMYMSIIWIIFSILQCQWFFGAADFAVETFVLHSLTSIAFEPDTLTCRLFQFVDRQRFFIASDLDLLLDIFKTELNFLQYTWKHMLGRPIVTLEINQSFLGNGSGSSKTPSTIPKLA